MFGKRNTPTTPSGTTEVTSSADAEASPQNAEDSAMPWARVLYDPPRSSGDGVVMEDYLPAENLVESYATQWYRFQYMGRHFAIRPKRIQDQPLNYLWSRVARQDPAPVNIYDAIIIGYAHPNGQPSTAHERLYLRERAVELVRNQELELLDIVAIHQHSQWFEPMLLVPEMDIDVAEQIAEELGQEFFIRLGNDYHSVHQKNGRERGGAYTYELLEMGMAPCPMNLGPEFFHSPKRAGGPWVSRSMEVAGQWQVHFRDSHALLACQPCQTRPAEKGQAILRGTWAPASRYKYIHITDDTLGDQKVLRTLDPVTLSTPRVIPAGSPLDDSPDSTDSKEGQDQ